jgi:Raf kinase inhibitor-like YbhB/YbcL family protein
MRITSTAFGQAEPIPARYTGEGEDVSPPLLWTDLPSGTVSLALLCEDPDAPKAPHQDYPYVHWVLYNLAPSAGMLPEGLAHVWKVETPVACEQGLNSMGRPGYNGPYPPEGHGEHRYVFRLYALSRALYLPVRPMKEDLLRALDGAVLAVDELVGTYERTGEQQAFPRPA